MREALKAVLDFGFNPYGLETIKAYTGYRNIAPKTPPNQHGFIPSYIFKDINNQDNMRHYLNP